MPMNYIVAVLGKSDISMSTLNPYPLFIFVCYFISL
jgi:hypothetical protein